MFVRERMRGICFDIAARCRQFAAAPRGGLLLAFGSRIPAADGEPRIGHFADSNQNKTARFPEPFSVIFIADAYLFVRRSL